MPNPSNSDLVGEAKRLTDEEILDAEMRLKMWHDFPLHRLEFCNIYGDEVARLLEGIDALAQQLEQAEQRETRETRYREALERIEQTPHFENSGGVCPACMAEVALTPDEGADPGGR